MKRRICCLLLCLALSGCAVKAPETEPQTASTDFGCAVWISYLELRELLVDTDSATLTIRANELMAELESLGTTDVLLQVRPFGDAIYPSALFPASETAVGSYNGSFAYDPLPILIDAAHSFGMKIHGWVNPLRLGTEAQLETLSADSPLGQWLGTDAIRMVDGRGYLNPAYPEVRTLICDGITELMQYDLDGIHLDDYFYPTTDPSFDETAYESVSGTTSLADFRREQISTLVKEMYARVKEADPDALFGISPAGNIENDEEKLYADVRRWGSEAGFVDYLMPQIYYGYQHETYPFSETVAAWKSLCSSESVSLWVGIACYKAGRRDDYAGTGVNEWLTDADILSRQTAELAADTDISGVALYRCGTLLSPEAGVQTEAISLLTDTLAEVLSCKRGG